MCKGSMSWEPYIFMGKEFRKIKKKPIYGFR